MKVFTFTFVTISLLFILSDAKRYRIKRQEVTEVIAEDTTSAPTSCATNSGEPGKCEILTDCPSALSDIDLLVNNTCELDDQVTSGVCCSNVPKAFDAPVQRVLAFSAPVPVPPVPLSTNEISKFSADAFQASQNETKLEESLAAQDSSVHSNTAEDLHSLITFALPEAQELGKQGGITLAASQFIAQDKDIDANVAQRTLQTISFAASPLASSCEDEKIECPANKYRTINGSCNNLDHPLRGQSFTAFSRMSGARYADGVLEPRIALGGEQLPSCRLVSTTIVEAISSNQPLVDTLFMTFGQFVDHDLSQTPTHKLDIVNGVLPCCDREKRFPIKKPHPECMAIEIPRDDPFFKRFNVTCMNFVRSIEAASTDCRLGQREQQNQLTSYLDASHIYGILQRLTDDLREHKDGRLKSSVGKSGKEFPPHKPDSICKGDFNEDEICLETGDTRASEQPLLSVLHIVFLREHNRIAGQLAKLNPTWNDEILFQEARRILIAIFQHIIYNEFLPLLLGNTWINFYDLQLLKTGFYDNYDVFQDASVMNEFATAAFRYGHSLVQSDIQLVSENGRVQKQRLLDHFLAPFNGSLLESYVRGATFQASQKMDRNVVADLTNHLFQREAAFGLDLAALNCQRGRDHAIGSYTELRRTCGLEDISSFSDLNKVMDSSVAKSFSQVYKDVDDIDLWVGGLAERPYPGAVVGPVFACIIGEQFKRLREGDRFWYELGNTESSFNEAQLKQIRRSSLASILCTNTDIKEIQPLAFITASRWNPKVPCKTSKAIPRMSLRPWKNEPIKSK